VNDKSALAFIDDNTPITDQDVMDGVDLILKQLNETNEISTVDMALKNLSRIENVSSLAKAKLLSGMYHWWKKNADQQEDDFFDYLKVMDNQKRVYAERLIRVWDYQEVFPVDFKSRKLEEQIVVANALSQGYEISDKQWKQLEQSADASEIREIIRNVKNKNPRKSALNLSMDRDGTITAWKDNKPHFVGYLDVKEIENDEVVAKSIERILTHSGISKK
jgi:hypothetical protein